MVSKLGFITHRGSSMIEVLVTVVIISFGLLGLAGMQARMQTSEVESYQRAQALVLLNDMAERISTNRLQAASYVTASAIEPATVCEVTTSVSSIQQVDTSQWCNALHGAAEFTGTAGSTQVNTGAMLGARGCVASLPNNEYFITVAWQGLLTVPVGDANVATNIPCGAGAYDAFSSACASSANSCRRTVTTIVRIG